MQFLLKVNLIESELLNKESFLVMIHKINS